MNKQGFSFFELLLVVGIIVIITSAVKINADNIIRDDNVYALARQLSSDINFVQQKAVEESRTWVIEFSESNQNDAYSYYPLGEEATPRKTVMISDRMVNWGNASGNYMPSSTITFNASGAPTGEVLTIGLNNSAGEEMYISVAEVTGRTRVIKQP